MDEWCVFLPLVRACTCCMAGRVPQFVADRACFSPCLIIGCFLKKLSYDGIKIDGWRKSKMRL